MIPYKRKEVIGDCTLYLGDCLEILPTLEKVDAVITDPPYSSGTRQSANRVASAIPKRGEKWARAGITWDSSYSSFGLGHLFNALLRGCKERLVDGGHLYAFIDWRHYPLLSLSVEHSGLYQNNLIVWDKGVYALGGNYRSQHELLVFASNGPARELLRHDMGNVVKTKRVSGGDHPTEKPTELIDWILRASINDGETVFDPFMGSGTTGVSCVTNKKKFIGIEVVDSYFDIACERITNAYRQERLFA
jgi:DNA modification methylase